MESLLPFLISGKMAAAAGRAAPAKLLLLKRRPETALQEVYDCFAIPLPPVRMTLMPKSLWSCSDSVWFFSA